MAWKFIESAKITVIVFEHLKTEKFCSFSNFLKNICKILILILGAFWLIFGQKVDSTTPRANFFHKRNDQEKFQLKMIAVPPGVQTATWKKSTHGNLRNGHRYEKHVVIFRPTLLTVADLFKPTVSSLQYLQKIS